MLTKSDEGVDMARLCKWTLARVFNLSSCDACHRKIVMQRKGRLEAGEWHRKDVMTYLGQNDIFKNNYSKYGVYFAPYCLKMGRTEVREIHIPPSPSVHDEMCDTLLCRKLWWYTTNGVNSHLPPPSPPPSLQDYNCGYPTNKIVRSSFPQLCCVAP